MRITIGGEYKLYAGAYHGTGIHLHNHHRPVSRHPYAYVHRKRVQLVLQRERMHRAIDSMRAMCVACQDCSVSGVGDVDGGDIGITGKMLKKLVRGPLEPLPQLFLSDFISSSLSVWGCGGVYVPGGYWERSQRWRNALMVERCSRLGVCTGWFTYQPGMYSFHAQIELPHPPPPDPTPPL